MPVRTDPNPPNPRSTACNPAGRDLRAAGFSWLGTGTAFLGVAWFGDQPAFTGVGFAFIGLGLAWLLRGRDKH